VTSARWSLGAVLGALAVLGVLAVGLSLSMGATDALAR
jgi:hypothetical protein